MISRSTDVRSAVRSRQRGFLLNPYRFGAAAIPQYVNPADKSSQITLSNSDRDMTMTAVFSWSTARAIAPVTGKRYWEFSVITGLTNFYFFGGVAGSSAVTNDYVGVDASGWGYAVYSGLLYANNATSGTFGVASANGDVFQFAHDAATGKLWFGMNNTFVGSPAAGTGQAATTTGTVYPAFSLYEDTTVIRANLKTADLVYSPPSGFSAW